MSILLDGTSGVTTPGVVNTAGETIATTLSVTGASTLTGAVGIGIGSPTTKLDVNAGSNDAVALLDSTNANGGHLRIASSGTVKNYVGCAAGFITSGSADDLGLRAVGKISFATNGAAAQAAITAAGLLQFNSGYGSAATAYGCRAWVNFNGSGTVAIRASGNVSSITDGGVGTYDINFTTAMVDANYSFLGSTNGYNTSDTGSQVIVVSVASIAGAATTYTTSAMRISVGRNGALTDSSYNNVAIFR